MPFTFQQQIFISGIAVTAVSYYLTGNWRTSLIIGATHGLTHWVTQNLQ